MSVGFSAALATAAVVVLVIEACGVRPSAGGTDVPITVLDARGPYPGTVAVQASTSMAQLKAILFVTGLENSECPPGSSPPSICWPTVESPSDSLLIAFSDGIETPGAVLKARLEGTQLSLVYESPAANSNVVPGAKGAALLELASVSLKSLPKAVIKVLGPPPFDRPPLYGGALVDLRGPLPTPQLSVAISDLTAAGIAAAQDAKSRFNTEEWIIHGFGVMDWRDDGMDCARPSSGGHSPTSGYVLFLAEYKGPRTHDPEYHSNGTRTVFCADHKV